ncbi:alpha,alpha-trehalase TreF [Eleftheria terrae]|uniref:alpha,alpha-trehalase TreF n=1 Tax=Eleftheria terrae TaxID=1597781 RepID=UPI00263AE1A7|nr:alpha,alpha-trehalase TreF [Eleftheria terrae]WKB53364.1 alpha,alpha-trehalase TreF [Eleftheria terrae]
MKPSRYGSAVRREAAARRCPAHDTLTPADRYAELFTAVQAQRVFADSKTFVDASPRGEPQAILAAYREQAGRPGFDLASFVRGHFEPPGLPASGYVCSPGEPIEAHIDALWPVLTRKPLQHPARSSLLRLPHPYVVPGGRFAELYYWDSYFTMLGLAPSGRRDLLQAMTDNFAYLIDTYGHVPNGTRTYYLSRSQPPVFALMVEMCEGCGGPQGLGYLPQLMQEYAWWMDGADALAPGQAHRRVVKLPDGALLNRYWDDRDTPREEAYVEDVATAAAAAGRPANEVYRDLRAAAESGWDFSSRWLRGAEDGPPGSEPLSDIATTAILPVDLNALLHKLETKLAELCQARARTAEAAHYRARAEARREAMQRCMWDPAAGAFFDHDWRAGSRRRRLTAATVVPLFVGMASTQQAAAVATTVQRRLLAPGGLSTTEVWSPQQWDRPNGWAPLQWMAVCGLARYGHEALADQIAGRWLATVQEVYRRDGKLVEKYALRQAPQDQACGGGGGEYPLQDGFGWTNGVTRRLLASHPGRMAADRSRQAATMRGLGAVGA